MILMSTPFVYDWTPFAAKFNVILNEAVLETEMQVLPMKMLLW